MTRKKKGQVQIKFPSSADTGRRNKGRKYLTPVNGPRTKHWVAFSEMEFRHHSLTDLIVGQDK